MSVTLAMHGEEMNTPTPVSDHTSRRRRHRRQNPVLAAVARFAREWWPEILIVVLLALGIFLLAEQTSIRQTLLAWLAELGTGLADLLSAIIRSIVSRIRSTSASDAVAYGLFVVVLGLLAWRTRERLMAMPRFTDPQCPRCGGELHRIHRRWLDRAIDVYVPVRRYQCANHECRWHGLRVKRHRHG